MCGTTAVMVVALVAVSVAYQPRRTYEPASAHNYQQQILQWQQTVTQRSPYTPNTPYTSYSLPWGSRNYGLYRQDTLPPQPTIVAPAPAATGPAAAPAPDNDNLNNVAPVHEIDNKVETEQTPQGPYNPLRAQCKAPRGQFSGSSCGKFVNCWDDFVVEQDCPLGLYFNEKAGYCDYAWNVPCNSPPPPVYLPDDVSGPGGEGAVVAPGLSPDPDLGAPGAKCPTEFGTYRSNRNCGVFYMCVGYQPFEFTCPGGLNFHKDLQVCDYPYRVECHGVPSNQPPPETTLAPGGETTPPSEPAPPTTTGELAPPAPLELTPEMPLQPNVVPLEPTPGDAPGSEAFYQLKKVPASLVDAGAPCRPNTIYRLNPACSSVAVCRNGYTQVLNCGTGTSYDVYSDRCVPFLRARC